MSTDGIIAILRKVTATVKIMPFVFVLFQLLVILCDMWIDDTETTWLDLIFYVSPIVILFEFILSYLLELCIWHRLQCSLPLVPMLSVVVDEYMFELNVDMIIVAFAFVIFMFVASLFNGYMLFCKR